MLPVIVCAANSSIYGVEYDNSHNMTTVTLVTFKQTLAKLKLFFMFKGLLFKPESVDLNTNKVLQKPQSRLFQI